MWRLNIWRYRHLYVPYVKVLWATPGFVLPWHLCEKGPLCVCSFICVWMYVPFLILHAGLKKTKTSLYQLIGPKKKVPKLLCQCRGTATPPMKNTMEKCPSASSACELYMTYQVWVHFTWMEAAVSSWFMQGRLGSALFHERQRSR